MVKLGQNFLADPNLLDAIVRSAPLEEGDVVLEVGGGGGALTERLAPLVETLHVIELDERMRDELEGLASGESDVRLHWGDAMKVDLAGMDPPPTKMVANLPYSIATPLILRTIDELPGMTDWVLMVQREIADRLRAAPGSRQYGAPSVMVQLACEIELLRPVGREVFKPRPRVDSALIALRRRGPGASTEVRELVREGFAHRRKALARSLELARAGTRERAQSALGRMGLDPAARAEALAPQEFVRLAEELASHG
jgi:16S rRNA (adenine1518-N6/adenine1519-N6)-dimethyltransferase